MNTTTKQTEITEEMLMQFYDAKEAGKSFPEAVNLAQADQVLPDLTTLRDLWDLHGRLMREAHNISPDMHLLERTLLALPQLKSSVTAAPELSYVEGVEKKRITHVNTLFAPNSETHWKIIMPVALVLLAVVTVMNIPSGEFTTTQLAVNNELPAPTLMDATGANVVTDAPTSALLRATPEPATFAMMKSAPTVLVTGNLDDLTELLSREASTEVLLLNDSTKDFSLIASDAQAINEFNTTYDATNL